MMPVPDTSPSPELTMSSPPVSDYRGSPDMFASSGSHDRVPLTPPEENIALTPPEEDVALTPPEEDAQIYTDDDVSRETAEERIVNFLSVIDMDAAKIHFEHMSTDTMEYLADNAVPLVDKITEDRTNFYDHIVNCFLVSSDGFYGSDPPAGTCRTPQQAYDIIVERGKWHQPCQVEVLLS